MDKKWYTVTFSAEMSEDDVRAMKKYFYDAMNESMQINPCASLDIRPENTISKAQNEAFEYAIKGVVLNAVDMYNVKEFYEAHCTAEYIMDNYDVNKKEAIKLGYEVRRRMSEYNETEEEAIYEVMKNY